MQNLSVTSSVDRFPSAYFSSSRSLKWFQRRKKNTKQNKLLHAPAHTCRALFCILMISSQSVCQASFHQKWKPSGLNELPWRGQINHYGCLNIKLKRSSSGRKCHIFSFSTMYGYSLDWKHSYCLCSCCRSGGGIRPDGANMLLEDVWDATSGTSLSVPAANAELRAVHDALGSRASGTMTIS